jgi:hypothetical protein
MPIFECSEFVTKLSYGYDDVDCVLLFCMYVLVVMYRKWGGVPGAVDSESL